MSGSHLRLPFGVSFGWPVFLSCQHQLSRRMLVNVHHPWIQNLASLVLVTDLPKQLGIPADCSDHRLLAASSVVFREDADNCQLNSFRLIPFSCLTFHVHLIKAWHLLIVPYSLQAFNTAERIVSINVWHCKIG